MDLHDFTPSDLTENLKCFVCNTYLSYFPISLCSNNQSLCGRCTVPEGMISFQNEALEMVCLYLQFPCRYNIEGCLEELSPEDVPEHEKTCPFRIVRCILNKPRICEWSGSLPTLVQHCKEAHPNAFVANGSHFELNLSTSDERDYVIEHGDSFVIFSKKYECKSKVLEFSVYNSEYVSDFEGGHCQLKVTCGDTSILHDFEASTFEEKIYTMLFLPFIKDCNSDPSVSLAKIRIGETDFVRGSIEERSGFVCVYCSQLALPPIYRRTADMAVICYSCGGAGRRCSHCTILKRVRDTILEQFVVLESYPCSYQKNGCRYISKHTEIIQHQANCCYETVRCPIYDKPCVWEGASKDIEDHISRKHSEFMMDLGDKVVFSLHGLMYNQGFLKFGKQLFTLVYLVEQKKFLWIVEPLGQCTEKYKYEISIFDADDDTFIASIRQISTKRVTLEHFSNLACSSYFAADQVLRLKPDEDGRKEAIKFSVQIFRS